MFPRSTFFVLVPEAKQDSCCGRTTTAFLRRRAVLMKLGSTSVVRAESCRLSKRTASSIQSSFAACISARCGTASTAVFNLETRPNPRLGGCCSHPRTDWMEFSICWNRPSTAVLSKIPHTKCCASVPNRPQRGRRGLFGTLLQQLECGIFERKAVRPIQTPFGWGMGHDVGWMAILSFPTMSPRPRGCCTHGPGEGGGWPAGATAASRTWRERDRSVASRPAAGAASARRGPRD